MQAEHGRRLRRLGPVAVLTEAWLSLRANPVRSWVAFSAVAVGVALSTGAVLLGDAGQSEVLNEFDERRTREVELIDDATDKRSARDFPLDLGERLKELGVVVDGGPLLSIDAVPAALFGELPVYETSLAVFGVDVSTLLAADAVMPVTPAWPNGACGVREALIGRDAAEQIGVGVHPGDPTSIRLAGVPFAVVGVIEEAAGLPRLASSVVVPECAARQLGVPLNSRRIYMKIVPGHGDFVAANAPLVARVADPAVLRPSFIPDAVTLREVIGQATSDLVLMIGIGVAGLAALMIGFANAASVAQRAPEIALRRVFGARRGDIYFQLVMESMLVGVVGGVAGATLGMGAVVVAALLAGWEVGITPLTYLVGPVLGVLVGAISGLLPARAASRLEPREALQRF